MAYWIEAAGADVEVVSDCVERLTDEAFRFSANPTDEAFESFMKALAGSITRWHDVLDVDGQQIPYTAANLRAVMEDSPRFFAGFLDGLKDAAPRRHTH